MFLEKFVPPLPVVLDFLDELSVGFTLGIHRSGQKGWPHKEKKNREKPAAYYLRHHFLPLVVSSMLTGDLLAFEI